MATLNPELYTVAWIAPLEIEARAAVHMLDRRHEGRFPMKKGDSYVFIAGEICGHNVAIATLPAGQMYGTGSIASLVSQVVGFFPNLRFGLLVGLAAGLPNLFKTPVRDIRLGDVMVAFPEGESTGLVAYDEGTEQKNGFQLLHSQGIPFNIPTEVRSAIDILRQSDAGVFLPYYEAMKRKEHPEGNFVDPGQGADLLYQYDESGAEYLVERQRRPGSRRTHVWYGPIGSGDKLVKDARKRDELRDRYNVIGLEMEAVGTVAQLPSAVIRGVCDYGDRHKSKTWQPYAAAMAAAYAKALLSRIPPNKRLEGDRNESSMGSATASRGGNNRSQTSTTNSANTAQPRSSSGILVLSNQTPSANTNDFGLVLSSLKKHEEVIYQQALADYEKTSGADHPSTLMAADNLGSIFVSQKKYAQAERMYRQVLAGRKKILGADHPDTLIAAWNLWHSLKKQDRHTEVRDLLETLMPVRQRELYGSQSATAELPMRSARQNTLSSSNSYQSGR